MSDSPLDDETNQVVPRIFRLQALPLTERRVAMRRLAAAGRCVIDLMSSTAADAHELNAAAERLEEVVEILRNYPAGSQYEGIAEMANAGDLWARHRQMIEDGDAEAFASFDYSPIIGLANPMSPPIVMNHEGDQIVGTVTFGAAYEGPPGCVHGGYVAAAFDELLGAAQSISGAQGMTASLTVDYRSPTPLDQELRLVAWVDRREGRKIWVRGTITVDDRLTAEATGLFIAMNPDHFRGLLDARLAMEARRNVPR